MPARLPWKELVYTTARAYCAQHGTDSFTLEELRSSYADEYHRSYPNNQHVRQKLSEILRQLTREQKLACLKIGKYVLLTSC